MVPLVASKSKIADDPLNSLLLLLVPAAYWLRLVSSACYCSLGLLASACFCLLPLRLSAQDWVACRAESSSPKIHTGVRRFQIVFVDQKIHTDPHRCHIACIGSGPAMSWPIKPVLMWHIAICSSIFLCSLDSQRSIQRVYSCAHVSLWSVRGLSLQGSSKTNCTCSKMNKCLRW